MDASTWSIMAANSTGVRRAAPICVRVSSCGSFAAPGRSSAPDLDGHRHGLREVLLLGGDSAELGLERLDVGLALR
jgi:hypothetical protein